MDGNFIAMYESKLTELLRTDEKKAVEYLLDCAPILQEFYDTSIRKESYDKRFGTKILHGTRRKEIYIKYIHEVEKYKGNKLEIHSDVRKRLLDTEPCKNCGKLDLQLNDARSEIVCVSCGLCERYIGDGVTYKDEHENFEKIFNYTYKRDNHFNEWLLQFQARETTTIPDDVIENLRSELKKQKIKTLSDITHTKIRTLLRKLRLNKYYEHVPYITNILNGIHPPRMEQVTEDKLRKMFKDIQEPFDRNCPKERKNFLSYSYVLYKFCELLGEDEFLECFPLLKSKEKLHHQDVIWKKICKDLQWEFIPTV